MSYPRIVALVRAGGEGRRLRPLTAERSKPAVDLGRGCRIVDFALANLANSGVPWIYLLAQYKPAPLIEHLDRVWRPLLARRGCMLRPVLPAGTAGEFKGTADAAMAAVPGAGEPETEVDMLMPAELGAAKRAPPQAGPPAG